MNAQFNLIRATIVDNQDPEKLGRVKIQMKFLGGQAATKESHWARVARPTSQANAGDWFLPDLGDEVLVGFENSDVNHPIVIASLFNTENKPFQTGKEGDFNENGKNNLRAIKTKAGHMLLFDDLEGKETLTLQDKDQNTLLMDSANEMMTLKDKASNSITLNSKEKNLQVKDANGNEITLSDSGSIIKAKSGDEIELSDGGIKIKSSNKISIEGSSEIEIGKGASKAVAFGEEIMKLFNQHSHSHAGLAGTTSPPLAPMTPVVFSKKVKSS